MVSWVLLDQVSSSRHYSIVPPGPVMDRCIGNFDIRLGSWKQASLTASYTAVHQGHGKGWGLARRHHPHVTEGLLGPGVDEGCLPAGWRTPQPGLRVVPDFISYTSHLLIAPSSGFELTPLQLPLASASLQSKLVLLPLTLYLQQFLLLSTLSLQLTLLLLALGL